MPYVTTGTTARRFKITPLILFVNKYGLCSEPYDQLAHINET
jgi:hypothetical protein